ncbi:hypothetical protein CASFOL_030430 [Castilleja foliolosa]|uniref:Uncharacterized protein n=1 Tax=Castilleja foliolosa TaxID=1961234 RepID=A0ABD3C9Z5_9LAMI
MIQPFHYVRAQENAASDGGSVHGGRRFGAQISEIWARSSCCTSEVVTPVNSKMTRICNCSRIPVVIELVGGASTELGDGWRGFELRLEYQICNVVSFWSVDFGTVNILLVSGGLDDCLLDKSLERWMMLLWTEMLEARSSGADLDEKPGCCWISR